MITDRDRLIVEACARVCDDRSEALKRRGGLFVGEALEAARCALRVRTIDINRITVPLNREVRKERGWMGTDSTGTVDDADREAQAGYVAPFIK